MHTVVKNEAARSDLFILLQFCVVNLSDLRQLGPVVRMFRRVVGTDSTGGRRCGRRSCRPAAFLWPGHTLCKQHVVQSHQLWIRRLLLLGSSDTEHCGQQMTTWTHWWRKGLPLPAKGFESVFILRQLTWSPFTYVAPSCGYYMGLIESVTCYSIPDTWLGLMCEEV